MKCKSRKDNGLRIDLCGTPDLKHYATKHIPFTIRYMLSALTIKNFFV